MATGRGDGCADCHRHRALSGARTVIYGDPLPVHPPFPDTHPRWCPALAPTRHAPTVPATCATGDLLFRPVIHSCCYRVYWSSRCAVRCATSLACVGLALPAFEPMNTGLRNGSRTPSVVVVGWSAGPSAPRLAPTGCAPAPSEPMDGDGSQG